MDTVEKKKEEKFRGVRIVPEIDQEWTVERIVKERVPKGWEEVFKEAMPELQDISDILNEQEREYGTYYPLKRDLFRAFELTPAQKVKVVMLGQDPYPQTLLSGLPRATGLSFSVRRDDEIPFSLKNIYKELEGSIEGFKAPCHGDLTEWAYQGVFLLNMCLTVIPGKPGSHKELWLGFIVKVLAYLAEIRPRCIYVLLGLEAQKVQKYLGERSIVFTSSHPSGRSADKGFLGSKIFRKVNQQLIKQGETPIKWQLSD